MRLARPPFECSRGERPQRDVSQLKLEYRRLGCRLDAGRAHDANLIAKVRTYLAEHDTDGLQIEIMTPEEAKTYGLVDAVVKSRKEIPVAQPATP